MADQEYHPKYSFEGIKRVHETKRKDLSKQGKGRKQQAAETITVH